MKYFAEIFHPEDISSRENPASFRKKLENKHKKDTLSRASSALVGESFDESYRETEHTARASRMQIRLEERRYSLAECTQRREPRAQPETAEASTGS